MLGQILKAHHVITEQQLANAVGIQRRTGQRLGEALISAGACSEGDIAKALASQLNLPVSSPDPEQVDQDALRTLGEDFLREKLCLPLMMEGGEMLLAVADPFDLETTEEVQRRVGRPMGLAVATPRAIIGVLDLAGDQEDRIEGILAEARERAERAGSELNEADLLSAHEIVSTFLAQGIRRGCEDVHVEPEGDVLRIRYRIDGVLQPGPMIPSGMSAAVIARIKVLSNLDIAERRLPQDGHAHMDVDGRDYDLRVSTLPSVRGECAVLRVLDPSKALVPWEHIGLTPEQSRYLEQVMARPHGMFLVTGPTGAGKTTTLYGMLGRINALERKVITIEDPVEYRLPLIRQVQANPEIGLSFAAGLRSILRQDPDVILLGEIRDAETAQIAIRASMTGHLVLSTLHTNSAAGAVTRLADIGVDPFLITSTLVGVLGQRLVRTLCRRCGRPQEPRSGGDEARDRRAAGSGGGRRRSGGCSYCGGTGFRGRTAVHEVLRISPDVRRLIAERRTEEELVEQALSEGFQPLHVTAGRKVAEGVTTLDEVRRVVTEDH